MAHERAHVERRDFAVLLASQLHQAVFWFSPLSWWLHRRLASLAELASDDRAMAATGNRPGYAAALLEMGRRSGPLLRGLAMARPATLVMRIERSLTEHAGPAPAGSMPQVGLAFAMTVLSVMAAGTRSDPGSRVVPPTWASTTDFGRSDLDDSPMLVSPIILATPGSLLPQEAALLPIAPAAQAPAEHLQRPRAYGLAPTPIRGTEPMITRALDRKPVRGARAVRSLARPAPEIADGVAPLIVIPSQTGLARESVFARSVSAKVIGESPAQLAGDMPSCTGHYVPKLGVSQDGEQLEMIEARYFQNADGSEALKLLLGVRVRVKLTGMDVERASVRATVITKLPAGVGSLKGAMTGLNGTLSYECRRLRT